MLLNASEGMIFRDSRFCKEELALNKLHDELSEEEKVMRHGLLMPQSNNNEDTNISLLGKRLDLV